MGAERHDDDRLVKGLNAGFELFEPFRSEARRTAGYGDASHVLKSQREEETPNFMPNYLELPVGENAPELVNAVIEIPLDGINKYEYDKQLHVFRLDRNLFSPVHYPGDYGFIPSTFAEDGDPLDVLVLVDSPSFTGCVLQVRPIGVLDMIDQGQPDQKILAVGEGNPRYTDVANYSQVYPHILREIKHFFSIYKDLEGKRVEVRGWGDAAAARALISKSKAAFDAKKKSAEAASKKS
jgi:inorganic pyrophosphatase